MPQDYDAFLANLEAKRRAEYRAGRMLSHRPTRQVTHLYAVIVPSEDPDAMYSEGVARGIMQMAGGDTVALPLITDDPGWAEVLLAKGREHHPAAHVVTYVRT